MTAPWQRARRILCIRLDSLGDVLMCTPAMRALRQAAPGRTLTLLGSPSGAAAQPFIPELDDAIAWDAPWMKTAPPGAHGAAPAPIAKLAARAFDAAVIFTTYTQSALPAALLCQLAGIPLRLAHCRENPYDLLTDWIPDPEPATLVRHEVQRQLALVQRVGCRSAEPGLSFVPRPADFAAARMRLSAAGVAPDRPWILLHPGASAASRRYPPAHWAQVLRESHYPLYPYVEFAALRAKLATHTNAEIDAFLKRWPDTLAASDLRKAWLRELARRGDWASFQTFYAGDKDLDLQCNALQARLGKPDSGKDALAKDVQALWADERDLPAACDGVIAAARAQGALTDKDVWTRIERSADMFAIEHLV